MGTRWDGRVEPPVTWGQVCTLSNVVTPDGSQTQRSRERCRFGSPRCGKDSCAGRGGHPLQASPHPHPAPSTPGVEQEVTAETTPGIAGRVPLTCTQQPAQVLGCSPSPAVSGVTACFPPWGSWAGAVNAASAAYISGVGLLALPRPGHTGSPLLKPLRQRRRAGKAAPSINGSSVCRRGGDGAASSAGARPAHGELEGGGGHGPVAPGRGLAAHTRNAGTPEISVCPGHPNPDGFRSASLGLCCSTLLPPSVACGGTPIAPLASPFLSRGCRLPHPFDKHLGSTWACFPCSEMLFAQQIGQGFYFQSDFRPKVPFLTAALAAWRLRPSGDPTAPGTQLLSCRADKTLLSPSGKQPDSAYLSPSRGFYVGQVLFLGTFSLWAAGN